MHSQNAVLAVLALIVYLPFASAVEHHDLREGNPSNLCGEISDVFDPLKVNETSAFCSSYMNVPKVTSTAAYTVTAPLIATYTYIDTRMMTYNVTMTTAAAFTSYVFLPGNAPERPPRRRQADKGANNPILLPRPTPTSASPNPNPNPKNPQDFLPPRSGDYPSMISSACACLLSSTRTSTFTTSTTVTTTKTITVGGPSATVTKTIYPCATAESGSSGGGRPSMPSPGPAYGLSNYLSQRQQQQPPGLLVNGTSNRLFYLDTRQGASAVACCHACYFELEYCVQAFYYSYQGCVVMQPRGDDDDDDDDFSSEIRNRTTCPRGALVGLVYGPDNGGPFRSTGDIGGPCGEGYTNL